MLRTTVIVPNLLRQQDKKPPSGQSQMEDMHGHLLREVHHKKVMTLKRYASAEFTTAAWPVTASDLQPVEACKGSTIYY